MMREYRTNNYNYMERVEEQRIRRLARAKQVKRQKVLLFIGIFITILMISILSFNAFVYAKTSDTNMYGTKQFKSCVIYCGDTVESIANANYCEAFSSKATLIKEIRAINHIDNDEALIPGNYIVIPYYSGL